MSKKIDMEELDDMDYDDEGITMEEEDNDPSLKQRKVAKVEEPVVDTNVYDVK